MKLEGKVYKFGDNINTDFIISGRYKFSISDMKELSRYIFEDIRPNFYSEIIPGKSIVVGGINFGLGSSREQAPWVIKEAGIICVVAKSFARIFYRNSYNIGLPLVEADTTNINENDEIVIDLEKGIISKKNGEEIVRFTPFDNFRKELLRLGGIINYLKKYGDLKLEV
ncbi:MAG: 3-isopropylmalate dehydratase [Candidatus Omnitrophica bacterium]|nr:3-isopropylmalate dehydratase [Candidatus Omnitrophota bacterium]MCM8826884.1 3-isopropylmalate dehydratase [Candidatus Omnitrophota bacterium]